MPSKRNWTMTLPLVILAVFAVAVGWVGIPKTFPLMGGLMPNWFHEFVGGTLLEHPEALAFSCRPAAHLAGGCAGRPVRWAGWSTADVKAGAARPGRKDARAPVYTLC